MYTVICLKKWIPTCANNEKWPQFSEIIHSNVGITSLSPSVVSSRSEALDFICCKCAERFSVLIHGGRKVYMEKEERSLLFAAGDVRKWSIVEHNLRLSLEFINQ